MLLEAKPLLLFFTLKGLLKRDRFVVQFELSIAQCSDVVTLSNIQSGILALFESEI